MRALNGEGPLTRYPGSPLLARRLMREGDRLVVNELHPEDRAALAKLFARDAQTKVLALDGFTALKSLLPPKERRGVVLVDPAYEVPGELERLVQGLKEVARRFATGTILLWYPIKDVRQIAAFRKDVAELEFAKALAVEADDPQARRSGAAQWRRPHRRQPAVYARRKARDAAARAGTFVGARAGRRISLGGAGARASGLASGYPQLGGEAPGERCEPLA